MLEKIALQKKLISSQECEQAVNACKSSANYELALKNYFLTHKLIDPLVLDRLIDTSDAIKIMKTSMKFGAIAVNMGFITQKDLASALALQKQSATAKERPKLIGQILLDEGIVTREQISEIILEQKKMHQAASGGSQHPETTDQTESKNTGPSKEGSDPPKPSQTSKPSEPKIESYPLVGGLILEIEDNGMAAYLTKTDNFNDQMTLDDIHAVLIGRTIQYGIADDDAIQGFLENDDPACRFKIARGSEAVNGKDARIEYYFDTDHLKAGGMDEEGKIDFKDRGEIPKIDANTLLAEKFPLVEAKAGRTIFGSELPAEPVEDKSLKAKTGVLISEDGQYAYSQISGHAKLSWSGNISVVDVYTVKGDVGYETGHLDYDGNIEVKGTLKSGFKIKGYDIKINGVDGGLIHSEGDISIINHVNGATIFSRGHISANFIHGSTVSCLGNLYVEKEIVDSTVDCSGSCQVSSGKIINSKITANQGVHAKTIGNEKTGSNLIVVGQDAFVKKELIRIEKQIIEAEKDRALLEKKKEMLLAENAEKQTSSTRDANELNRLLDQQRSMEETLRGLEAASDQDESRQIRTLKADLKQREIKYSRLDTRLNELFDEMEKNEAQRGEIEDNCDRLEDLIEDLNQERENYIEWTEANQGAVTVIAEGNVCNGTIIQGRHATKEIKQTVSNVRLIECRLPGETDDTNIFEIQIHDNIKKR